MTIHPDAFVHPKAIVEAGATIGARTRVWAFAHVLPGAVIGEDCNICDHVFVENEVIIGNRVTVKCGVQLWDGITLEDDVFVGPNATFTNDPFPRSKQYLSEYPKTIIECGASIGANATLLPGLVVGSKAMVGAGAVVTRGVPKHAIVVGNPARITGYIDTHLVDFEEAARTPYSKPDITVAGVRLIELPEILDLRGKLSFAEIGENLPFKPERYFLVYGVPTREVRGEHAHHVLHEFLVCVKGRVSVVVDDGKSRQEIRLSRPNQGLYLPPKVWTILYRYSEDAILLVFASHKYDFADYIRDYAEFINLVSRPQEDTA